MSIPERLVGRLLQVTAVSLFKKKKSVVLRRHQTLWLSGDTKRSSHRQPGIAPDFGICKDPDKSQTDCTEQLLEKKKSVNFFICLKKYKVFGEYGVVQKEYFILILSVLTNNPKAITSQKFKRLNGISSFFFLLVVNEIMKLSASLFTW